MKGLTKRQIIKSFVAANVITQFLFFIDEGYYDFRWMRLWGNWVVYALYVAGIWGVSLGLQLFFNAVRHIFLKWTINEK